MYKYFVQKNNVYVSRPEKYIDLIFGIGLIVIALVFAKYLPSSQWYYTILPTAAGFYNLAFFGRRVEFDNQNKHITTSYFGWFKKMHNYDSIYNFATLRHMAYGIIHSGTDISIIIRQANQEIEIPLFSRIVNPNKIQTIISEIKQILI
jgi:hypothetical protein